jgi:hypothetical protein
MVSKAILDILGDKKKPSAYSRFQFWAVLYDAIA